MGPSARNHFVKNYGNVIVKCSVLSADDLMDSDKSDSDNESSDRDLRISRLETVQPMDTSPPEQDVEDEHLETGDFSWLQDYFKI